MRNKIQTSITLSRKAKDLIEKLTVKLGVNKTSVIEIAVRKLAEKENIS